MLVCVEGTQGPMARLLYGALLTRPGRLTAVTNARVRGGHARHTAGTEYAIVCSAIALTTRGKKPLERSQHLITRLVRETEMGESLRDFGGRVSAVMAG